MNFFGSKISVATHNGSFHADEVFAVAALSLWAEKEGKDLKIIRTRDEVEISKAQIAVDVGMQYDPEKLRFDHHQKGGAGEHTNGIPYASFGLVWKHYGEKLCGKEIAKMIESKLVIPIDARDNGINTTKVLNPDVPEYTVMKELVYAFRSTWQDPKEKSDECFVEFLDIAKKILAKEIRLCKSILVGEVEVAKEIKKQNTPEILILEEDLPWDNLISNIKNIKIVIYPEPDYDSWCAETARNNMYDFDSHRAKFPEKWRGLRGDDLATTSGIEDAVFCHRAGFFAVTKSKEGAIKMAKMALQESNGSVE